MADNPARDADDVAAEWLPDLIEMARDWRFSNEFLGSVFRYRLQQAERGALNDGGGADA